jgi:hypothetical protein
MSPPTGVAVRVDAGLRFFPIPLRSSNFLQRFSKILANNCQNFGKILAKFATSAKICQNFGECDHAQWTPPEEAAARNGTVLASLLLRRSLSSQVAF